MVFGGLSRVDCWVARDEQLQLLIRLAYTSFLPDRDGNGGKGTLME